MYAQSQGQQEKISKANTYSAFELQEKQIQKLINPHKCLYLNIPVCNGDIFTGHMQNLYQIHKSILKQIYMKQKDNTNNNHSHDNSLLLEKKNLKKQQIASASHCNDQELKQPEEKIKQKHEFQELKQEEYSQNGKMEIENQFNHQLSENQNQQTMETNQQQNESEQALDEIINDLQKSKKLVIQQQNTANTLCNNGQEQIEINENQQRDQLDNDNDNEVKIQTKQELQNNIQELQSEFDKNLSNQQNTENFIVKQQNAEILPQQDKQIEIENDEEQNKEHQQLVHDEDSLQMQNKDPEYQKYMKQFGLTLPFIQSNNLYLKSVQDNEELQKLIFSMELSKIIYINKDLYLVKIGQPVLENKEGQNRLEITQFNNNFISLRSDKSIINIGIAHPILQIWYKILSYEKQIVEEQQDYNLLDRIYNLLDNAQIYRRNNIFEYEKINSKDIKETSEDFFTPSQYRVQRRQTRHEAIKKRQFLIQ
ncbi:hypothetical protein PPERSA_08094 [Pseudocohnilembus persalinus]|uniref:Uncharacterized protein n=1 Tax=Pseudocohnilembus persalinus TaxID=266149 RepID=A0A0V0R2P5_PSEPJ|nr:hypothetical protein PPERSA_08094 [Pseudocohnilembus persalinus]|eukprot:KRX08783.1 hypothetical protein PPERSA_08094 [Pseudocohnilembus persalinus]